MSAIRCVLSCFFFKQKTAYEMRISDWSSDVCSSDLLGIALVGDRHPEGPGLRTGRSPHRLPRRLWLAGKPAFIDLLRDEGADVRVHPARDGQEDATVARDGGMIAQHPFEAGEVCRRGMGTLDDLRQ